MSRTKFLIVALTLHCSSAAATLEAASEQPEQEDRARVYRPQPEFGAGQLVPVAPEEIKRGFAYNYYHERLGRRVWGFARQDGSFQYAFGEGTMVPLNRFDLQLAPQTAQGLLEQSSPGLGQRLAVTGGTPGVMMTAEGTWQLLPFSTSTAIFDIETGHRWEWHGERRVAVLHTLGDQWQVVSGRYRPLNGAIAIVPSGCGTFHRAGSARDVLRTPEAAP
jgi:hypothetical protein